MRILTEAIFGLAVIAALVFGCESGSKVHRVHCNPFVIELRAVEFSPQQAARFILSIGLEDGHPLSLTAVSATYTDYAEKVGRLTGHQNSGFSAKAKNGDWVDGVSYCEDVLGTGGVLKTHVVFPSLRADEITLIRWHDVVFETGIHEFQLV